MYDAIGREIAFSYDKYGNLNRISYEVSKGHKSTDDSRSRITEERFVEYEYQEIPESEIPDISEYVRGEKKPLFRLVAVHYPEDVTITYEYQVKPFIFSFDGRSHITNFNNLLTAISNNVKTEKIDGKDVVKYSSRREFFYDTPNGTNYSKPLFNGNMEYFKISKQQVFNRHKQVLVPTVYRYYDKSQTDISGSYSVEIETGTMTTLYVYKDEGTENDHVLRYTEIRTTDGFLEKSQNTYDSRRTLSGTTVYRLGSKIYAEEFNYNAKGQLLNSIDRLGLYSETRYNDTFGIPEYQRVYIKSEDQEIVTEHEIDPVYGWVLKSYLHVGQNNDKRRIKVQEMVYDEYGNVIQQIDTNSNIVHFEYDSTFHAFPVKMYTNVTLRNYSGARTFADSWTETPNTDKIEKAQKFMVYNSDGTVWVEVDNDGYAIEHYYDSLGTEIEKVIPDADDNHTIAFDGSLIELEGSPYWTSFLQDRTNNPGIRILIDRTNALTRKITETDRSHNIYTKIGTQDDGLGNVEADIVYYGSADPTDWRVYSESKSTYNSYGQRIAITDADAGEAFTRVTAGDGTVIHKYDKTWLISYDDLGRQKRIIYPNTRSSVDTKNFTYNDLENSVTIIDAENRKIYSRSDWNGNIVESISYGDYKTPETDFQTYKNTYDEANRIQIAEDPEGNITGYDYDERNLLIKQWYNFQDQADYISYDDRGFPILKSDRKGQLLEFIYDELGRATTVHHYQNDSQYKQGADFAVRSVQSDFDRRGNTIRVESDELIEYYEYNYGNLVTTLSRKINIEGMDSVVNPVWQGDDSMIYTFTYQYNEGGLLTQMQYPDGAIHAYDYDSELARLEAIKEGIDSASMSVFSQDFQYNKAGVITEMQWANGTRQK